MVKKNDVNSMEKEWDCLEKLIKKFESSFPSFSTTTEEKVELFTKVHNLSMCKDDEYQEKLYARHRKVLEDYLTTVVMPGMQDKKDELMLREFVGQWKSVKELGRRLYHGFKSLDLSYVLRRRNIPGLEDVKRLTFRDLVYKELNGKVKDAVIALIDEEREGEEIDRALLKEVLNVFLEMGEKEDEFCYYKQHFEQHMIEDTGSYYSGKASSWLLEDSISCPDYLKKAEECLEKEKERVSYYMHESSEEGLIRRVQHELLVVNCSQLLEHQQSGFRALIREEKFDHLSRIFKLYNEIPGRLELVAHLFKQHITDQGNALVEEAAARNQIANDEEVQNCFEKIIELNDKHLEYVKACFKENTLFHRALKEAFELFCNKAIAGAPSAELLAIFADNLIKKSDTEKLSHAKVEETLEKLVKLLAYFNDKDLFVEFYRKKLAKRLIFDKNCNQDADKFFITKLKEQCGGPFTSKLEGMLTDVVLSRETHKNLQDWFDNNPSEKPNFDLSVSILTTGCWPSYNSSDLNLPSEMVKGVEIFTKFYATKTNSRKLRWIYSLGNCHINGRFEQKTIEIIVSTYQASALLLFNDADRLSFSEIKTQLNLSHGDIVRVLHSLSSAKYKILNKEPKTKSISETDSFEFNSKFSDKMRRIRIPLPPKPIDERKKISEVVNQDRRYLIDAALVRIMKSRKVLGHQQLVSECVEALSKTFKPDIKAIKQRIEDLITREFIERDSKNPNVFNYLAQAC